MFIINILLVFIYLLEGLNITCILSASNVLTDVEGGLQESSYENECFSNIISMAC